MPDAVTREHLRALPSVDRLAARLHAEPPAPGAAPPTLAEATAAARTVVERRRAELLEAGDGAAGGGMVAGGDGPAADVGGTVPHGARAGGLAATDHGSPPPEPVGADLLARARAALRPSVRRVLNGTGVVVHTNLGRAPLAAAAVEALRETAGGWANVELDLDTGARGGRDEHVGALLRELTGAEDALVVNNGAAAALLAVAALAPGAGGEAGAGGGAAAARGAAGPRAEGHEAGLLGAGPADARRVVVSRGQLVEIGGGYRVPEVIEQAGARLVEVGTTNRTRRTDYERALAAGAGLVLRVHPSNFRVVGFVEEVPIEVLCGLGAPVVDDLGSGALAAGWPALGGVLDDEPAVPRSIAAGVAVACFSGDKLLGGPQAGILVGSASAIEACRRHPLARALRLGRLPLVALEATLRLYRDPERALREIPVLAALAAPSRPLRDAAARLAEAGGGEVVEAVARVGGGALPLVDLPGPVAALPVGADGAGTLAARLRAHDPPLVARIADGRVLVDPRTLRAGDDLAEACAVVAAVRRAPAP